MLEVLECLGNECLAKLFEKSYNILVSISLIKSIGDQAFLSVVRGLLCSDQQPRHLRDLSNSFQLSPAGVSDILSRLKKLGVLIEFKKQNRIEYSLKLENQESLCLKQLFELYEETTLKQRAVRFSLRAKEKFEWIDQAFCDYQKIKAQKQAEIKTMTPLRILRKVALILKKFEDCSYCLIGGHAASLYRKNERFTKDIDFAFVSSNLEKSKDYALECIEALGMTSVLGFIPAEPKESKRKSVCMVTCEAADGETKGIIDILLPELPWIKQSVERAQLNLIDLGFAKVPVITPEDLIIAKCYALRNNPDRFQDLDDIKEIFEGVPDLDWNYLSQQLKKFKLKIPKQVKKYAKNL